MVALLAPIPSSLTLDGGTHATRLFLLLPPLIYFIARGITNVKYKLLTIILIVFFIFHFLSYLHQYFVHYPREYFLQWNYGFNQLFTPANQTNRTFISDTSFNATLPYLFYQRISPKIISFHPHFPTKCKLKF